ncbi:MAG: alpha/beta hydrolase [Chloroflexota bacterium]
MPLTAQDYIDLAPVDADYRYAYGDDPNQFGDLYLPPEGEKPALVILIHGGCWRAQYGLEPIGQMAADLAQHGVSVWSIEYRRLGNGGGWPTTFEDVGAAVDYTAVLAEKHPLDLSKIVVVGHSAGGHLGLWLAARAQLKPGDLLYQANPLAIDTVISLAGVCDLETAVARNICQESPAELMGGSPEDVPAHYRFGSPHAFLPLGTPHIHIAGQLDAAVPFDYVEGFVKTAEAQGDQVELIPFPNAGHFEIVTPTSDEWVTVRETILASG